LDESVCGNVANLSAALSNLSEIDPMIMSEREQEDFRRMKARIFKALKIYCDCLPELPTNESTEKV
jgi:hypothetical protein